MVETTPTPLFAKWATGFSGCDGGDLGDNSRKAIWICGIEWGGGHEPHVEGLEKMFAEDVTKPSPGYEDWRHNLAYIYNWQAMKMLCAVSGQNLQYYKRFAEQERPFTSGRTGYFKMNLYPLSFRNTSHSHWRGEFSQATGLRTKSEYLEWIRSNRFPIIAEWAAKSRPRLIICTGITYQNDFSLAFGEGTIQFKTELIDNRELKFGFNRQGALVVVIPFMVNRYGLTRNVSIQKFGERIKALLR